MTIATPNKPLFLLAAEYAALAERLIEAEGDLTDEQLAAEFDAIQQALPDKVESCQFVYREKVAQAEAIRAMVKPYLERAERIERAAERIKGLVFRGLQTAGLPKVETTYGGARLQASPPAVVCEVPAESLPEEYRRVTVSVDAKAILAAAKAAKTLPSGVRVEQRVHLRWI